LRIKGRVFPAAVESLILVAHYADGAVVRGESAVSAMHAREGEILRLSVEPEDAPAPPEMLKVVEEADVVVLSSGSLYTSTIPSLLGGGTREALESFSGPVVYIANVMTQPGETTGFAVSDHLRAISDHVGSVVTDVLVHSGGLPEEAVERYEAEGAAPVVVDREEIKALGVRVWESDLIYHGDFSRGVRHDPRGGVRGCPRSPLSSGASSPPARARPREAIHTGGSNSPVSSMPPGRAPARV
jgi:uncharacterized cofD-like protein